MNISAYSAWFPGLAALRSPETNLTSTLNCSKDARLPVQLQRAMAAEAEAAREARAKVRKEGTADEVNMLTCC